MKLQWKGTALAGLQLLGKVSATLLTTVHLGSGMSVTVSAVSRTSVEGYECSVKTSSEIRAFTSVCVSFFVSPIVVVSLGFAFDGSDTESSLLNKNKKNTLKYGQGH